MYNEIFIFWESQIKCPINFTSTTWFPKKFEKVEIRNFYQAIKIIVLNKTTALLEDVKSAFL